MSLDPRLWEVSHLCGFTSSKSPKESASLYVSSMSISSLALDTAQELQSSYLNMGICYFIGIPRKGNFTRHKARTYHKARDQVTEATPHPQTCETTRAVPMPLPFPCSRHCPGQRHVQQEDGLQIAPARDDDLWYSARRRTDFPRTVSQFAL